MAYPTTKDTFPSTLPTSPRIGHSALHNQISIAVRAIEDKLGVTASTDAASFDYLLKNPLSISPGHKHSYLEVVGLGTAATLDTGTTANKVVVLDSSAKLPAVDGSQLINLPTDFTRGNVFGPAAGLVVNNELVLWSTDSQHIKGSGILSSTLATTIANSHTHLNKSLLDTYDQTNSDITSAISLKHSHANKTLLDSIISSGDGSKYLANDGTYKTVVGSAIWGNITGTLLAQTDLSLALAGKQDTLVAADATHDGYLKYLDWLTFNGKQDALGFTPSGELYDAIVAPTGGDYTTLGAALAAGKKTIFIRPGNYIETDNITITLDGTTIIGENRDSVIIQVAHGKDGIRVFANNTIVSSLTIDGVTNNAQSCYVVGDGSTVGNPITSIGNFNMLQNCKIMGAANIFAIYLAGASYDRYVPTLTAFETNDLNSGNCIDNCIISSEYPSDGFSFSLQKNGRITNTTFIGSRISWYMTRDCSMSDCLFLDSLSQGIFCALPCYNSTFSNIIIKNPNYGGFKTQQLTEHDPILPGQYGHNLTLSNVQVHNSSYISFEIEDLYESNLDGLVSYYCNESAIQTLNTGRCTFSNISITNPGLTSNYGSGIKLSNTQDCVFSGVTITDNQTVPTMRSGIANEFDTTCTRNQFNNIIVKGLNKDRSIRWQSNNCKFDNIYAEGGKYAGILLSGASYCQLSNIHLKNNCNDANNSYAELWLQGTASNNQITTLITESDSTNKAKYGIQIDSGCNYNYVLNHKNIGAVTLPSTDAGTGNVIGITTGGGTWGSITGTLSNQTDLQTALNGKASTTSPTLSATSSSDALTLANGFDRLSLNINPSVARTSYGVVKIKDDGTAANNGFRASLIIQGANNANALQPSQYIYNYSATPAVGLLVDHNNTANPGIKVNKANSADTAIKLGKGVLEFEDGTKQSTAFNTQNTITKEPTGFTDPANVGVTYDPVARTVTLTGTVAAYYRGTVIAPLVSGWVSPAHANTNGVWFLYYDGASFGWSNTPWTFDQLQIAFANYGATDKFGIRECHGLMPWQAHKELHETLGTYRTLGGILGGYVLNSSTATNRRPTVTAATINDEDLPTVNAALTSSLYTKTYNTGTGTSTTNFTVETAEIVPLSGNQPYYNQYTGGAWQQTLLPATQYMSVWLYAMPTASDTGSQKYRYLWVQGQSAGTLASQQALSPNSLDLGTLTSLSPEFVCIAQVIIQYTGGNWVINSVVNITGSKIAQSSSTAVIPTSHSALSNLDWTNSGHTGTAGVIPAFSATGAAAEIATGTAGQVLTSNGPGATPTFQTSSGGGMTLLADVTLGSAAATISSGTITGKSIIECYFYGLNLTSGTHLVVRFNSDNGANYDFSNTSSATGITDTVYLNTNTVMNKLSVRNISSSLQKAGFMVTSNSANSGGSPNVGFTWKDTSSLITSIIYSLSDNSNLPIGTRLVVYGM